MANVEEKQYLSLEKYKRGEEVFQEIKRTSFKATINLRFQPAKKGKRGASEASRRTQVHSCRVRIILRNEAVALLGCSMEGAKVRNRDWVKAVGGVPRVRKPRPSPEQERGGAEFLSENGAQKKKEEDYLAALQP